MISFHFYFSENNLEYSTAGLRHTISLLTQVSSTWTAVCMCTDCFAAILTADQWFSLKQEFRDEPHRAEIC